MATMKPRITISLEPHRHELVRRVALLRRVSMSAVVSELVDTVAEPLERLCVVAEAAQKAPGEVEAGLRGAMDMVERGFRHHAGRAIEQHDLFLDLAEMASAGKASPVADPRPVITGVRSRTGEGAKPGRSRVSANSGKKSAVHAKAITKGRKS